MEGFLIAYPAALVTLLVAAVVFSHVHAPLPRTRQVMRRIGFAVHVVGVLAIAFTAVDTVVLLVTSANPLVVIIGIVDVAAIWWITGGIAMRFGVRREELYWWREGGAPQP